MQTRERPNFRILADVSPSPNPENLPAAHITLLSHVRQHDLGSMTEKCDKCRALRWRNEVINCCSKGDVHLEQLPEPPPPLRRLLQGSNSQCRDFQRDICKYNNALTFTSCTYTKDTRVTGGFQPFQIRGELFHFQGPLEAAGEDLPVFVQNYVFDPLEAATNRLKYNSALDRDVLEELHCMLLTHSPFIEMYKTAREKLAEASTDASILLNPQMRLILEDGADKRRANLPTSTEVSIFISDEDPTLGKREIVLAKRQQHGPSSLQPVHTVNAAYMPLHYVLIFPYGRPGWHPRLLLRGSDRQRKALTIRMFHRYHLQIRPDHFHPILQAYRLCQKFIVDAWATIEKHELNWLRHHQRTLRKDLYKGLFDAIRSDDVNPGDDVDAAQLGQRVILPSSHIGSDRAMQQLFQDSMAIVRFFGKPTLFITFTANPGWPEVVAALDGHQVQDRPDIMARAFELKKKALLQELNDCFGSRVGQVWTLEFQKRGLPHVHVLLFLADDFLDPDRIDGFIRAELPPDDQPRLQQIIKNSMTHSPCGLLNLDAVCMQENRKGGPKVCSKGFPKAFCEATRINEDGYAELRRRNNGRTWDKIVNGHPVPIDNRWVVPYSPYLCLLLDAHINVEVCSSVKAVKYIHKYVYKGGDIITVGLKNKNDEIERYVNGRYIGAQEAMCHILEHRTHSEEPPVEQLAIHLPDEQTVLYDDDDNVHDLNQALESSTSSLLAFFEYNRDHQDSRNYLYQEFPQHYVLKKLPNAGRQWRPRQKGFAIGRMYHISPAGGEKFFLRLLLTTRRGPTSFEHLRTVDGVQYTTFREACVALGLLEDDDHWVKTFDEASTFQSGYVLRVAFAGGLISGDITCASMIWNRFKHQFCDDLEHRLRTRFPDLPLDVENLHLDYGLYLIGCDLATMNHTLEDYSLPTPQLNWNVLGGNALINEEMDYDQASEEDQLAHFLASFNEDQRQVFETIIQRVDDDPKSAHFFLQGAGGTGKTYLYKGLCHHYRSKGAVVLCVASSGIAALLLPGGRTAHSRFKIPLEVTPESVCGFRKKSDTAALVRRTKLIIWDEVPMQHKNCIIAVNNTFKDIMDSSDDFGGIPIVFGGDFAQTLPVIPKGSRGAQVNATIRKTDFWQRLILLKLSRNMRLQHGQNNGNFARWIAELSYNSDKYGMIVLPDEITNRFFKEEDLCEDVYPTATLSDNNIDSAWLSERAILTLRNDTATAINAKITGRMGGQSKTYYSTNRASTDGEVEFQYTPEFLQSQTFASIPPHELNLKVNMPVMLLRNMHPAAGLTNGTRLKVLRMRDRTVEAMILGGEFHGQIRVLFRITVNTSEKELPFVLSRHQLPIRPCFAITINKSQGQSLGKVGVDLSSKCFSHGQLYVALSRATDVSKVSILLKNNEDQRTENVVYPEVLLR